MKSMETDSRVVVVAGAASAFPTDVGDSPDSHDADETAVESESDPASSISL